MIPVWDSVTRKSDPGVTESGEMGRDRCRSDGAFARELAKAAAVAWKALRDPKTAVPIAK